jgi:hypothetical protein
MTMYPRVICGGPGTAVRLNGWRLPGHGKPSFLLELGTGFLDLVFPSTRFEAQQMRGPLVHHGTPLFDLRRVKHSACVLRSTKP